MTFSNFFFLCLEIEKLIRKEKPKIYKTNSSNSLPCPSLLNVNRIDPGINRVGVVGNTSTRGVQKKPKQQNQKTS